MLLLSKCRRDGGPRPRPSKQREVREWRSAQVATSLATRQGNDRSILVEDYLSSHHREERGNVPDLILWNRPIISRQHYEVRELSRLQRSFNILFVSGVRRPDRVKA